jgi:hypothetical protein
MDTVFIIYAMSVKGSVSIISVLKTDERNRSIST